MSEQHTRRASNTFRPPKLHNTRCATIRVEIPPAPPVKYLSISGPRSGPSVKYLSMSWPRSGPSCQYPGRARALSQIRQNPAGASPPQSNPSKSVKTRAPLGPLLSPPGHALCRDGHAAL